MFSPDRQHSVDSNEYQAAQTKKVEPSLAQSLRQRREFNEKLENERAMMGSATKMVRVAKRKEMMQLPSQTDETGSAIRIRNHRPQTPRINLLKLNRTQFTTTGAPTKNQPDHLQHPLFSKQAMLPLKRQPLNFLNPIQKIGTLTTIKPSMVKPLQS